MSKGREKNCRLCLTKLDDDYNVIEEVTKEIFKVLILKVDLSVSEEPLLCKRCMKSVQEAFDFKSTCFAVDEQVVSLALDRNSAKLDIRDVYLNEYENKAHIFNEDYNVCRFCLSYLEKSNFSLLNDLKKNLTKEMLLKCIPELDPDIINEPVVCAACMKSLESYYSFAMQCQDVEENIMKYCEIQGTGSNGQISLNNVVKYLFKGLPNCSKMAALEDNLFFNEDTFFGINNVLKIEQRELIIKDENKYGDYTIEENLTHEYFLRKHMLIYKDEAKRTVYRCNLCSYKGNWKCRLRSHMLTHMNSSDVVMYRCAKCTYETKSKSYLMKHMVIHKDSSELTMYKCNLCSYKAKWRYRLRAHMLIHKDSSDVVMYRCAECTYATKYKSGLKKHMMRHKDKSEVTMYKCDLCSYKAPWMHRIRSHMLVHKDSSDVVMFRCALCTYKTKYKSILENHMFGHKEALENVTYKCALCTFETNYKQGLKDHMLVHKDASEIEMIEVWTKPQGLPMKVYVNSKILQKK